MTELPLLLHGLTWRSDLPLHVVRPAPPGDPDVVVRLADPRPVPEEEPVGEHLARLTDGQGSPLYTLTRSTLRFHGTCDFALSGDLRHVDVHLQPGADPALASVLATGMLATVLLVLRGHPVLHASAVDLEGQAVAFFGPSGAGKSSMASLLCKAGAQLITDDVLRVDLDKGPAATRLGATESRLRKSDDALRPLDGSVRRTADGRLAVLPAASPRDHVPLRCLLMPQPTPRATAVAVQWLPPREALLALAGCPRILGWTHADTNSAHFAFLAALVRQVPVGIVSAPWGPPFSSELSGQLRDGVLSALSRLPPAEQPSPPRQ